MAYVNDFELEEENEPGGPLVPGGGTGPATAGSAQAPASSGGRPKTPGRFADLGEYLRVNAPQEFGQKVAGKIGEEITRGQQTIDSAANEFRSRADAAKVEDTQGLIGQVNTDPMNVDFDAFKGLKDAEYKGPVNLSDTRDLYGQVKGAAGTAVGKANASKSEGGRFALLDSYFGRPDYTQGQKTLDNVLIQNDPNSQQAFDQMRQNASQLQQNVNQTGVDLGNYGAGAKATTQNTRSTARSTLGIDDAGNLTGSGAIGGVQSSVKNRLTARQQEQQDKLARAKAALQGNDITGLEDDLYNVLGLQGLYSTWGQDATRHLTENELKLGNVATTDEQRRMDALSKLAEMENTFLPDASLAGTMDDESTVGFKQKDFLRTVDSARDSKMAAAQAALQSTVGMGYNPSTNQYEQQPILDAYNSMAPVNESYKKKWNDYGYAAQFGDNYDAAIAYGGDPRFVATELKRYRDMEAQLLQILEGMDPSTKFKWRRENDPDFKTIFGPGVVS